jgi:hypothetical protein
VLVLAVVLAGACSSSRASDEDATSTTAPVSTTTSAPTTTEPPLRGDPLVVAEQGVSSFPDPFDTTASLGGYGVVVRNPNADVMATGVRVATRLLDDAGAELLVDNALLNAVMPGAEMAVGRTLIEPIPEPTRLEVTVEVTEWLPPTATEGGVAVEQVVTEPEEAGGAVTRFTLRSSRPEAEDGVDVTALYRAEDGRILGAESTSMDLPPGEPVTGQIRLLSPIPDLATTDVYVGRGFAALTGG